MLARQIDHQATHKKILDLKSLSGLNYDALTAVKSAIQIHVWVPYKTNWFPLKLYIESDDTINYHKLKALYLSFKSTRRIKRNHNLQEEDNKIGKFEIFLREPVLGHHTGLSLMADISLSYKMSFKMATLDFWVEQKERIRDYAQYKHIHLKLFPH